MALTFLGSLKRDDRGSVAMIFGLVAILLCACAGLAVDVSRATGVSTFVTSSIDSVALSTARELQKRDMSDAEVTAFAQLRYNALTASRNGTGVTFNPLQIVVNRTDETVRIAASSVVDNYFAGLVGKETFNVNEASEVSYNVRVVELALMLDVTGSMNDDGKLAGMKLAAKDVIDQMIADSPRSKSNRIALAPYSAAVNVGALHSQLTGPGNDSVDNCVIGRDGAETASNLPPGPSAWMVAMDPASPMPDVDPASGTPTDAYECPAAEVLPLSNDKTELKTRVNNFLASGWTAGHLGAAWGWYLVSPDWNGVVDSSAAPAPANDEDTIKAVLLMTDGSFNTRFLGGSGATSDELTREICTNMKAQNIVVYAVAFDAPADAEATLRACASNNENYFSADNTQQLRASFNQIAESLTSLRLTK